MDIENARQKAENLRKQILYHNDRYYNQDSPEISDYEYDMLLKELEEIETAFPELITFACRAYRADGKSA